MIHNLIRIFSFRAEMIDKIMHIISNAKCEIKEVFHSEN